MAPNSLVRYLDELATEGRPTEVLCVDPNPHFGLLGPAIHVVKKRLGYAPDLTFTECSPEPAYVPHGNGNMLLSESDVVDALKQRGVIEGQTAARAAQTAST